MAQASGRYVTWRSLADGQDCCRIGPKARCFCGHTFAEHTTGGLGGCQNCSECTRFAYMPSRPEEVGEWWLPRRKGFDVRHWRAKCQCGHGHDVHSAIRGGRCAGRIAPPVRAAAPRRAIANHGHPDPASKALAEGRPCGCRCFVSAFRCVVCEASWEEHDVVVETRSASPKRCTKAHSSGSHARTRTPPVSSDVYTAAVSPSTATRQASPEVVATARRMLVSGGGTPSSCDTSSFSVHPGATASMPTRFPAATTTPRARHFATKRMRHARRDPPAPPQEGAPASGNCGGYATASRKRCSESRIGDDDALIMPGLSNRATSSWLAMRRSTFAGLCQLTVPSSPRDNTTVHARRSDRTSAAGAPAYVGFVGTSQSSPRKMAVGAFRAAHHRAAGHHGADWRRRECVAWPARLP